MNSENNSSVDFLLETQLKDLLAEVIIMNHIDVINFRKTYLKWRRTKSNLITFIGLWNFKLISGYYEIYI